MSFDWTAAVGGALGEAGNQVSLYAERLAKQEEKELEEKIYNRRQKAELEKSKALAKYNYDLNEERSVSEHGRKESSALNPETGIPYTNEELASLSPEERSKAVGSGKFSADYQSGKNKSGMVDAESGRPLTNEELASGNYPNAISEKQYNQQFKEPSAAQEKLGILGKMLDEGRITEEEYKQAVTGIAGGGKNSVEEKPEYKPGEALEKIAKIDAAIGKLNAGSGVSNLSDDMVASLSSLGVHVAGGKMTENDRQKAIASLERQRSYLETFTPDQDSVGNQSGEGGGILEILGKTAGGVVGAVKKGYSQGVQQAADEKAMLEYLKKAGGDSKKALELAKKDGWRPSSYAQ